MVRPFVAFGFFYDRYVAIHMEKIWNNSLQWIFDIRHYRKWRLAADTVIYDVATTRPRQSRRRLQCTWLSAWEQFNAPLNSLLFCLYDISIYLSSFLYCLSCGIGSTGTKVRDVGCGRNCLDFSWDIVFAIAIRLEGVPYIKNSKL